MTTLAFDGRYIAVDSQVTQGDSKYTSRKVWPLVTPDGRELVVFGVGELPAIHACISALSEGRRIPEGDCSLVVHGFEGGLKAFFGDDVVTPVGEDPCAFGSGAQAARGAMEMGANAAKAVAVACTIDIYSSGPVTVFDTQTGKFKSSRKSS